MLYKIFQRLGLGEIKLIKMIVQFIDQLIRHSRGIIEDNLVKVDKFIFAVDFIIFDLNKKVDVSLIL